MTLATLPSLVTGEALARWLPGLLYAVVALVATERYWNALVWPTLLLAPIPAVYAVMAVAGGSVEGWRAAGLLPAAFPSGPLLTFVDDGGLAGVHWPAVWSYAPTVVAMCFIVAISVRFNTTALQLVTNEDVDLDTELRTAGIANLAVGTAGGFVAYQMLGDTVVTRRIGRDTRLEALGAVAVVAFGLLFGARFVPLLPQFLIGGLLAYIGLMFLRDWLVDTFRTLTPIEYAIVVVILIVIASVGFLEGVSVGILATIVLFVVDYARTDIVAHERSGRTARSRVTRGRAALEVLDTYGDQIHVLELHGFVFFGTATGLLKRIQARLEAGTDTRFVVVDFRRVTGLDATARLAFEKLLRLVRKHDAQLVASHACPEIVRKLDPELDDADATAALLATFEPVAFPAGAVLMRQGADPDVLYFIASGKVTARLERDDGPPIRLETMEGGSLVGELGFYTGDTRTASVVADQPTRAHRPTRASLRQLTSDAPEVAAAFSALVVRSLAKRTGHLMRVVHALQR